MKKRLPLILALLALLLLLFACTNGLKEEETSGEMTTKAETDRTEETTASQETGTSEETTAQPGTTGEETTTGDGEETTVPEPRQSPTRITFDPSQDYKRVLTFQTQCDFEVVSDPQTGEGMLKLSTNDSTTNDPSVFFNYVQYCKLILGEKQASADDYKYVVIKLKQENCQGSTFELFYCAGNVRTTAGDCVTMTAFDNSSSEWQYILFDLSGFEKWKGKVNGFRLDFMNTPGGGAGETMYISEIRLLESDLDYYRLIGADVNGQEERTLSEEEQKRVDELLDTKDPAKDAAASDYRKQDAAFEDDDLTLFFADLVQRIARNNNTSTGKDTYQMRMAKNEIECCQAILAASSAKNGLKVYLTDFTNANGDTLKAELLWGYYFNVDGQDIIDPLPPVVNREDLLPGALDWNNGGNHAGAIIPNLQRYDGFDIAAGENQTFVIKAHTTPDSTAGEYSATFTVKDAEGREVKKATVFVYVWDFALPEKTSCKTLVDLSWWSLYSYHKCFGGDDSQLYKNYYDYLLENRLCAYTLPYSEKGAFTDSRIDAYLNNPRVTAFQAVGWTVPITEENVTSAYRYLSQKPEWLEKSYFYPIDEPNVDLNPNILNEVNRYGKLLKENFPGYKLIVPMHVNKAINGGDYFTTVAEYVTAWCPHTFFFNTFSEYLSNRKLTYRLTPQLEQKYGTFVERMQKEQAGGDEVWWYVTRFPQEPEITLTMNTASINYRILFWQQKQYGVDGFLYYSVTDWYQNPDNPDIIGINAKHETDASYPYDVYGNGVLVYCGQYFGEYGAVGSYRLEGVRDGIEDYEYLTLLEERYGKEDADLLIRQITTSLTRYTDDADYFLRVRTAIGNLLDAK